MSVLGTEIKRVAFVYEGNAYETVVYWDDAGYTAVVVGTGDGTDFGSVRRSVSELRAIGGMPGLVRAAKYEFRRRLVRQRARQSIQ